MTKNNQLIQVSTSDAVHSYKPNEELMAKEVVSFIK